MSDSLDSPNTRDATPNRRDHSRDHSDDATHVDDRYHRGQLAWTLFVAVAMIVVAVHYALNPKATAIQLARPSSLFSVPGAPSSSEDRKPAFLLFQP